ncbi:hypothetical protein B0H17DRAFT_1198019 [Mycena rosella]|uniref:BTB domain-containing protein n=1 Tax=Mycena rosella TaxID=1033263 RepID=A0AAD7GIH7_MYCRO|nr:hypothetical protein B0H17DRAFT_1198019 [Mycena rosella]
MYKLLLALASPFFKGMFEIPQPVASAEYGNGSLASTRAGIPVIFLYDAENRVCEKEVVEFVLSACHPARLQKCKLLLSAELLGPVVDVGVRYDIDWDVKTALRDPRLLQSSPFLLFSIACRSGLAAEATLAATEALRFRVADFPQEPAMNHSLVEFHKRCGQAAKNLATPGHEEWISERVLELFAGLHASSKPCPVGSDCRRYHFVLRRTCPQWWIDYMQRVAANLEARPHSSTVEDQTILDGAIGKTCEACLRNAVYPLMRKFIPQFKAKQISELSAGTFV